VHLLHRVNRDDIGMIQGSEGPCLELETFSFLPTRRQLRRQNLDGNFTLEPQIPGPIHLTHSSGPNPREHLVVGEFSTDHPNGSSLRRHAILRLASSLKAPCVTAATVLRRAAANYEAAGSGQRILSWHQPCLNARIIARSCLASA